MTYSMNMLMTSGAVLMLLGLAGLTIPAFTTQQTTDVAKIGGLTVQMQEDEAHTIPPLVSGSALFLGIIMVSGGLYRRR